MQGLAPFGADIAVLVYNPALDGSSPRPSRNMTTTSTAAALSGGAASDATGVSAELQHERPELKILTWAHEEVAADALSITGKCYLYTKKDTKEKTTPFGGNVMRGLVIYQAAQSICTIQQYEASLIGICSAVTAADACDRV